MENLREEMLKELSDMIKTADMCIEEIKISTQRFEEMDENLSSYFPYPKKDDYFLDTIAKLKEIKTQKQASIDMILSVETMSKRSFELSKQQNLDAKKFLEVYKDKVSDNSEYVDSLEKYKLFVLKSLFKNLYDRQNEIYQKEAEKIDKKVDKYSKTVIFKKMYKNAVSEKRDFVKKYADFENTYGSVDKNNPDDLFYFTKGLSYRLRNCDDIKIQDEINTIRKVYLPKIKRIKDIIPTKVASPLEIKEKETINKGR